jgi:arylsulfatase A-like enzyme
LKLRFEWERSPRTDHGESLGEAERFFSHGFATTPQLAHVPMILRARSLQPQRRATPVLHVDVLPTLLELAGLEVPTDASGIARGPFLREERALPDRAVYCDIGSEVSAYSGDRFTRMLGLGGAWKQHDEPLQPSWLAFSWKYDSDWPIVTTLTELSEATRRYIDEAVPIELQSRVTQQERDALRLLGYIVEERDGERSGQSE